LIAEVWPQLREHFGEELMGRLSGVRGTASGSPWGPLALVASNREELASELQAAVSSDPGLLSRDSILLWFATRPAVSAEAVAEALVERLPASDNGRGVARYLLSRPEMVGVEPDSVVHLLEQEVAVESEGAWGNPALEVIAFLSPSHPAVQEAWGRYRSLVRGEQRADGAQYIDPHPRTYLAVAYAAVHPSELLWLLARDLRWLDESGESYYDDSLAQAAAHRIARDPEAKAALEGAIRDPITSHSRAAVLASLFAAAAPTDEALLAECQARLNKLGGLAVAPIVRDRVVSADVPATVVFTRIVDRLSTAAAV
jgi:hypothetical protein